MPTISEPSFTPRRKWTIALNVSLLIVIVAAVVGMINYVSRDYFHRFRFGGQGQEPLSSLTVHFLDSLTNRVQVTIYYDKEDPFYITVLDLLNEYSYANPKITVRTVDYTRDAGAAQQLLNKYPTLGSPTAKNLVIFESGDKYKRIPGSILIDYAVDQVSSGEKLEWRRHAAQFLGETLFNAAILDVTSTRQLRAYFLKGHGEHAIENDDKVLGYSKFVGTLIANHIDVRSLALVGTNQVPGDCNLLVIAGPTTALRDSELSRIDQYLTQGGRVLCLFTSTSHGVNKGLEKLLLRWGVATEDVVIKDLEHTEANGNGSEVICAFNAQNPLIGPLLGSALYLIQPRPVGKTSAQNQGADAAKVDILAATGNNAFTEDNPAYGHHQFPLAVNVEKSNLGVITERGTTRMIVVGESLFFDNSHIDVLGNRDFANWAINWLLERRQLLEGVGPRPIKNYRLVMSTQQSQHAFWFLLAVQPGAVLLIGAVVWFRRRK